MFREKGIPVLLGGNHPSILPAEASIHADAVVIGDGEEVWAELLKDLERNQLKPFYNPARYHFQQQMLPRRDLLSSKYRFESLETSRGCPFNCYFCSVTSFHGATWRLKPPELIEKELKLIKGKNIFLVDDNIIGLGKGLNDHTKSLPGLLK